MKKMIVLITVLLLALGAGIAWSQGAGKVSTELTSSAIITHGRAYFHGITVVTDGTNTVTLDVYGNTAAAVPKLIPTLVIPSSATDRVRTFSYYPPIQSDGGIYVNVSVTGGGSCKYMVEYQ